MAIDPVCGMTVDPQTAAAIVSHDGEEFYFCSQGCAQKFRERPERYLSESEQPPAPEAPPGTVYTCPMHPEVEQIGPGACPKCGMALEPKSPTTEEDSSELNDMRRRFWISAALTVPVLILAMGHMIPGVPLTDFIGVNVRRWIELALTTPVVLYGAWPFFVRAYWSVRTVNPNMFTLIGMGVAIAYLYSVVATVAPGKVTISESAAARFQRGNRGVVRWSRAARWSPRPRPRPGRPPRGAPVSPP